MHETNVLSVNNFKIEKDKNTPYNGFRLQNSVSEELSRTSQTY
jgi:hypothetical protein